MKKKNITNLKIHQNDSNTSDVKKNLKNGNKKNIK